MSSFRKVTEDFYVSPQIEPENVSTAAEDGITLIIINRPDAEMFGQPSTALIKEAAETNDIAFLSVPIVAPPQMSDIDAMIDALRSNHGKKTLAFCRSGTRSITLWAYAMAKLGEMSVESILSHAEIAGYDLSGHRSAFAALTNEA